MAAAGLKPCITRRLIQRYELLRSVGAERMQETRISITTVCRFGDLTAREIIGIMTSHTSPHLGAGEPYAISIRQRPLADRGTRRRHQRRPGPRRRAARCVDF